MKQLYKNTYLLYAFLGGLLVTFIGQAQTPNSWTQKADLGLSTPNGPMQRFGGVSFSIDSKGYFGTGTYQSYEKDFWEYDSATDTWTQKADFGGSARQNAAGFSVNGKGYIGTGYDGSFKKDFWEYNPSTNAWTQKADFGGVQRAEAVGFSINGKGYLGTGDSGSARKDFWEYDPNTDRWTQKADYAEERYQAVGFSMGGKGYIGTGRIGFTYKNDFWEYNPTTNTWTKKADFAGGGRRNAVGLSINGKGYIGTGSDGSYKNDFWEYNLSSDTWVQKANFGGIPRFLASGFSIGNKGYLGMGTGNTNIKDFWEFNPVSNSWASKAPFGGTALLDGVGFSVGNKGYITLGDDGRLMKFLWEYDPADDTWRQKADFAGEWRQGAVGFGINDKGYVGTGSSVTQKKDFWEYNPSTNSWTQKADFGGSARSYAVGFSINGKGYIGTGNDGNYTKDFWEYNPANNSWVQKADFGGLARLQAVGFNIGNKGYIGTGGTGTIQKDFWEYDPSTNRWTQKADLGGDARLNAVGFGIGSRGYIGTGTIGNISDDFWEFDPVSNSWSQKTNVGGGPRTVAVGFSIGGKGYIGTGLFNNSRKKDFWEYTPPCYLAASISPNTPLTVCSGGTLTLNGSSTGGYAPTYSWSAGGGAFTSTQQNPTFTIPTVTSSTNYTITLTVTDNGCTATATVGVRVDPVSVGGTVNSNQTICSGTAPANLSLSGQVGNVVRWDRATNSSFSSWNTISSTSTTLTGAMIGSLTADTYFRAIVKSGGCIEATSSVVKITVNPVSVGGSIGGSATVCAGTNRTDLALSGQVGAIQKWQSSLRADFSETTDIANTTTELAATNLTQTTYFRAFVKSGVCSEATSTVAMVTVNPLPTATITGGTTVCKNASSPKITFTGAAGTAPYTFTYKINNGSEQTITSTNGNSISLDVPTNESGTFEYSLVSVKDGSSTTCSQAQTGSTTVTVQDKPTITLSTLQQTLNEGNSQTFCDTDANPVNGLQFAVSGSCVTASPVWRVQVGSGAWSGWASNPPVTQLSNNQPHRYQAACDANCPVTYTLPIELTINYRSTVPQNVSLLVDGVTVTVGETKEVCSLVNMPLSFNANCGGNEVTLYSVDGGEYSAGVPTGLVDNQYHNYRLRCGLSNGTLSCIESESGLLRLKLVVIPSSPTVSISSTGSCNSSSSFSGQSTCGSLRTIWYNASTNVAFPSLPTTVPSQTTSYYARCQTETGCVSEKSNVVTFTVTSTHIAPVVTVSKEIVCTGTTVRISANCPTGSTTSWNTGITTPSFEVSFSNVTKQTYWAKCLFEGGCQSAESIRKDLYWNAFVVSLINIGQSKSVVKTNDRAAWASQFVTADGGPELEQSTQQNPTLYYVENVNKVAPRYWTINVDACALGTNGSLTFDMLATPETGVIRSFNTHENNAPYFMYANREGWTELYAQNHPAYGFYQDNGAGANVYDAGLPKGLYKLGVRYWDQKGWGSIYPSTRKPQGNVLAYQEYWFRIQSKDGVGVGAARAADSGEQVAKGEGQGARGEGQIVSDNGQQLTDNGAFATVLPNPVTNVLRLKVQESKGKVVQTSLMDASGRRILGRRFTPETNTHQEEFGVSELPTGIYFLQVQTHTKQAVLRVLKTEE